ncbi:MAG: hypothetical protein PHQ90_07965 [Sulfuricurvum sp.]|uniref:hypothetical protein n=1 Tax=Sulfuricurvum sp. TaxID=2025608 RepID=UPI00260CC428|nr:hypothetical protein [Sulfuricurvum sp.]MDD2369221.1 hypothetical protein [Sulfuricurvum sp.]MDD2950938.1 hypothetical protein [Sulfuricurvum sp.]MDD5117551.1 hypothetical protein [Sulfuricurvum sp.]
MKKVLKIVSSLMVAGVISSCYADSYTDGKKAFEEKMYSKSVEAFTQACSENNFKGCYELGKMYENGMGVAQNKYEAGTLYAQACRGGESLGCSNMTLSYDTP